MFFIIQCFLKSMQERRDDLINPYWIEDPDLKKGEVDFLSQTELQFWKDLLDKYLYPIDANKDEQVLKISEEPMKSNLSSIFIYQFSLKFFFFFQSIHFHLFCYFSCDLLSFNILIYLPYVLI